MTRSLSGVQTAIRRTTEYVIRAVRNVVRVRRVPSAERVVAVARGAKLQAESTALAQQPRVESGMHCLFRRWIWFSVVLPTVCMTEEDSIGRARGYKEEGSDMFLLWDGKRHQRRLHRSTRDTDSKD